MAWLGEYFIPSMSVLGIVAFTGVLLETINQFVDGSDRAKIKSKIEDLWLFIATLSTPQSVGEAIKFRKNRMKSKYVTLFLMDGACNRNVGYLLWRFVQ